jgi:macrocin-O-methyltransferase TylF-like protien
VLSQEQDTAHDLNLARTRNAAEDTARYIDEHMSNVQSFAGPLRIISRFDCRRKAGRHIPRVRRLQGRINFIADLIPSKPVHGFDSFDGLPESWRDGFGKGAFAINGLPPVRKNVVLHKGWFDSTVPAFHAETSKPIAFIHMDADLYSSTATVLEGMADRIVPGTVIQFDEFFNYPGWRNGEFKAFSELVERRGLKFSHLGYADQQVAVIITH